MATAKYKLNFDMIDPEYLKEMEKREKQLNKDNFMSFRINPHGFKKVKAGAIIDLDEKLGDSLCARIVPLHYQSSNPSTTGELVDFEDATLGCTKVPFAEKVMAS